MLLLWLYAELQTSAGHCNHGDVRLVNGSDISLGRVEVCFNDAWGTVCNSRFGANDARVICRQLGFSDDTGTMFHYANAIIILDYAEVRPFRSSISLFGQGSGPIFLHKLACVGEESSILECPQSTIGLHQCDHSLDAGVQCFGKSMSLA